MQPYPCICKEAVSGFEPMTNRSPRHNFTAAPGLALTIIVVNMKKISSSTVADNYDIKQPHMV